MKIFYFLVISENYESCFMLIISLFWMKLTHTYFS